MRRLQVGDVVGVDVRVWGFWVHHVGIVAGFNGYRTFIISKSLRAGGVVEQTLEEFSEGGDITYHPDLWGDFPGDRVVERAYRRIGEPWAAGANCEHFVREAHGLPSRSPQAWKYALMVGAATAAGIVIVPVTAPVVLAAVGLGTAAAGASSRRR